MLLFFAAKNFYQSTNVNYCVRLCFLTDNGLQNDEEWKPSAVFFCRECGCHEQGINPR